MLRGKIYSNCCCKEGRFGRLPVVGVVVGVVVGDGRGGGWNSTICL